MNGKSVLPSSADIVRLPRHVRFVPKADISQAPPGITPKKPIQPELLPASDNFALSALQEATEPALLAIRQVARLKSLRPTG